MNQTAKLILQDGTTFTGQSFGADHSTSGEVIFNTSMVGYPDSFTDPSYTGQIYVATSPLIGNYGIPSNETDQHGIPKYFESNKATIKGLIVSEYSDNHSHHQSVQSLGQWLKDNHIPAITGIDTRRLTKIIREHGNTLGKIIIDDQDTPFYNPDLENLVDKVSPKEVTTHGNGSKTIIAIDCGMKNNILRSLLTRDLTVIRVPWDYDFIGAGITFDGIFISNGPGNPALLKPLHQILQKALALQKPIFGICLGIQMLAHSAGATTYKLPYGHRSQNQPVIDTQTQKCYITSQNHGFAIHEPSLPPDWQIWLRNINDHTIEGIRHRTLPYFACQFHPEATPGPTDTMHFFDEFRGMLG
ncbi:carbamoyl-phosphate synthase (glutamine-hydrolyzing) small subunit [Candidatus Peregrinibacteria bacterium HGW-Peregrinibacteria-1]|jgi:carbamoyl-phosphate synthase small subunit|nr:MAG: carbamoyl-phosphate synthase (glutamine-hydrolyzing) small subunit [Candidatus Peregrinibacteria bacterium HGW-Peregrinibacteria-1]